MKAIDLVLCFSALILVQLFIERKRVRAYFTAAIAKVRNDINLIVLAREILPYLEKIKETEFADGESYLSSLLWNTKLDNMMKLSLSFKVKDVFKGRSLTVFFSHSKTGVLCSADYLAAVLCEGKFYEVSIGQIFVIGLPASIREVSSYEMAKLLAQIAISEGRDINALRNRIAATVQNQLPSFAF